MGFNFPNTPSEGAVYAAPTGRQYVYQGGVWRQAENILTPITALRRNLVVNPSMQISQELGFAATGVNAAHICDQWQLVVATYTASAQGYQRSDTGRFAIGLQNSSNGAPAAGAVIGVYQPLEGVRLAPLQWGKPSAIPAVLRFKISAQLAGTYSASLRTFAGTYSFAYDFPLLAGEIKEIVIPVPACTVGDWSNISAAGGGLVNITHSAGSTFRAPAAGVWTAGNYTAGPGITANAPSLNNIQVWDVGLYPDPDNTGVAPPFEPNDWAYDLAECERYYQRNIGDSNVVGAYNYSATAVTIYGDVQFGASMRAAPGVTFVVSASSNVGTQPTLSVASTKGFRYFIATAATAGAYYSVFRWTANARM